MSRTAISSRDNAKFKLWLDLTTGKGLRRHGLALLAGVKVINEALAKHPTQGDAVLLAPAMAPPPAARDLPAFEFTASLFSELDVAGTGAPLLVIRQPDVGTFDAAAPWPDGCTLFIGFQNPDNVGAVIRSAAAFGVARVVLLKEAAHPFLPKAARSAGPALLDVPLAWGPALTDLGAASAAPLVCLDAKGASLERAAWPARFGLLAGLEGPGLPPSLRAEARSIPMMPGQESLNGATAVAIALYAWRRSLSSS